MVLLKEAQFNYNRRLSCSKRECAIKVQGNNIGNTGKALVPGLNLIKYIHGGGLDGHFGMDKTSMLVKEM